MKFNAWVRFLKSSGRHLHEEPNLNQLGGMLHYSNNVPFKGFPAPTDLVGKSYVFATNVIPSPSFCVVKPLRYNI